MKGFRLIRELIILTSVFSACSGQIQWLCPMLRQTGSWSRYTPSCWTTEYMYTSMSYTWAWVALPTMFSHMPTNSPIVWQNVVSGPRLSLRTWFSTALKYTTLPSIPHLSMWFQCHVLPRYVPHGSDVLLQELSPQRRSHNPEWRDMLWSVHLVTVQPKAQLLLSVLCLQWKRAETSPTSLSRQIEALMTLLCVLLRKSNSWWFHEWAFKKNFFVYF